MVVDYITFLESGTHFVQPIQTGTYPANACIDAGAHVNVEAKHMATLEEYFKYLDVEMGLKKMIILEVKPVWLKEKEDEEMGFLNLASLELVQHCKDHGGDLEFINIVKLKNKWDAPYGITEHLTQCINQVKQKMKSLAHIKIISSLHKHCVLTLVVFKKLVRWRSSRLFS